MFTAPFIIFLLSVLVLTKNVLHIDWQLCQSIVNLEFLKLLRKEPLVLDLFERKNTGTKHRFIKVV